MCSHEEWPPLLGIALKYLSLTPACRKAAVVPMSVPSELGELSSFSALQGQESIWAHTHM